MTHIPGHHGLRDGWLPTRCYARLLIALAIAVGVLVPLALSVVTGSISIPHNDAWSHAVIARTFAETGRIELVGWNRSSLVGQIVVLGPLAGSGVVQHLWVSATAAVGLLATYRLVSSRGAETTGATAALVVAAAPQFPLLATSFMTDVPAYTAVVLALTLADTALATDRPGVLALSLAVGLWGVTHPRAGTHRPGGGGRHRHLSVPRTRPPHGRRPGRSSGRRARDLRGLAALPARR